MISIAILAGLSVLGAGVAIPVIAGDEPHRAEWRASTFPGSSQSQAAIDVDPQGNMVTVWSSRRQQGGRYGVYAQRFSPLGESIGSETTVNLWSGSHQSAPAVACDARGRTWIVWQSYGQDGDQGSIVGRLFDDRFEGGEEIAINQQTRDHQTDPVVSVAPDGTALVAWTSTTSKGVPSVRGRRLGVDGAPLGDELVLSGGSWPRAITPSVVADPSGGFVVVYAVADEHAIPAGIVLRRLGPGTDRLSDEIEVVGGPQPGQIEPIVDATVEGFVVVWLDPVSDGSDYGVITCRLDARGCPVGGPVVVNTDRRGPQNAPAIAVAPDGRFTIAWNGSDGDEAGVFAQVFARDGARLGGELRVNAHVEGSQAMHAPTATRRLAVTPDGSIVCVWSGDAGLGDRSSVNVTMLSAEPPATAVRPRGVVPGMMAASPHQPPTFDPRRIGAAEREIREGADPGFTGIVNTGWNPPDPHLAVGPDHVVLMTNGAIAFFTKDGAQTFQDEIEDSFGFWGDQGATSFVFDPETLYDPMSGRFFAMACEQSGATSWVLVAVSDDSDPNGTWHKYRFNATVPFGGGIDSPNIAVDEEAVYVSADAAGSTTYGMFIYDKASLLAGDPPAVETLVLVPTSTESAGIPPVSAGASALYMVEHKESGFNTTVRLIALQDALGTPTLAEITLSVPSYGPPEDPPQQGTSIRPETFDARFWSVAYRNGSVWATHHINSDRVLARWYEFDMRGWPDSGFNPTLVQSGEIDPGPGIRTYFSSITADDHGNAAICFARSSSTEFISMGTSFRYKSDPPGTFQPSVIQQTNSGASFSSRWGDYSKVEVDPVNGITFWAYHQYRVGSWLTWVQAFTPSFAAADLDLDGMVGTADLLLLLAAWGPCADCADCPADLDGNCVVSTNDLLILLASWG